MPHRSARSSRSGRVLVWVLLVIALLAAALVALGLTFRPSWSPFSRGRPAQVTFVVEPEIDTTDFSAVHSDEKELARFMETQVAMITSEPVILHALKHPDVEQTKWAKRLSRNEVLHTDEGWRELVEIVNARIVPNTNLIELRVWCDDPLDAATIANSLSEAYIEDYRSGFRAQTSQMRDVLANELKHLGEELARLRANRERLIYDNAVMSVDSGSSPVREDVLAIQKSLMENGMSLVAARSELARFVPQADAAGEPSRETPADLAAEIEKDPIVQYLCQRLEVERFEGGQPTEAAREQRIRGIMDRLAQVRADKTQQAVSARIDRLRAQVAAGEALRTALVQDLEAAQNRMEDLVRVHARIDEIDADIRDAAERQKTVGATIRKIEMQVGSDAFARIRVIRRASAEDTKKPR